MKSVRIEELSPEAFRPFGTYADMVNPSGEVFNESPVQFFRDMVPMAIHHPRSIPAASICRVDARPPIIDIAEIHSFTAEGNMPLDADALVHLAPATPNGVCPMDRFRVFRIPKGTFFTMNAGVWHHAPFVLGAASLNMLVILPERTYANDCLVVNFKEEEKIRIDGA